MNELYTIPKDCYSRMEAIKMFDKVKCYGDIELGYIEEVVAWQCTGKTGTMFLPIIKSDCDEPYSSNIFFVPIELNCPFVYHNRLFYYSEAQQLLQVDILFDALWAQTALNLSTDIWIEISDLRLCKAINLLTNEQHICWIGLIQDTQPVPYTFTAFLNTPNNFPENDPHAYQRLDIGDTFEQQGYLWQVENGNDGIQMTRICPTAYQGKTS